MTDKELNNIEKLATNNDLMLSDNLINFTKEITIEKDTIHVEMKNVYGNNLIYPVCFRAKLFTSITGKETLTRDAIYFIRQLGYKIKNKEVLIP
jgi:hypothetical protein